VISYRVLNCYIVFTYDIYLMTNFINSLSCVCDCFQSLVSMFYEKFDSSLTGEIIVHFELFPNRFKFDLLGIV